MAVVDWQSSRTGSVRVGAKGEIYSSINIFPRSTHIATLLLHLVSRAQPPSSTLTALSVHVCYCRCRVWALQPLPALIQPLCNHVRAYDGACDACPGAAVAILQLPSARMHMLWRLLRFFHAPSSHRIEYTDVHAPLLLHGMPSPSHTSARVVVLRCPCALSTQHGIPEYNALTDKHCAGHNFLDLAPVKQLVKSGLVRPATRRRHTPLPTVLSRGVTCRRWNTRGA